MKNNLKKPCKECPFKKSSVRGWLGGETPKDTYDHVMNEGDFACHMTRHKNENQMSRCAGSMMFLKANCKMAYRNIPLVKALATIKKVSPEIMNGKEFFEHHLFSHNPSIQRKQKK